MNAIIKNFKNIIKIGMSVTCLLAGNSAWAGQNILYYFSQPGDYIGFGAEQTFTDTSGNFSISNN